MASASDPSSRGDVHGGRGLYLHVPFCARACPYCDFDFEVGRRVQLAPREELYFQTLEREFQQRLAIEDAPRSFDTVYVGGGTPSWLGPQGLRRLFALIDRYCDRRAAREVSVELNPEHVDTALLDALEQAGVSRVSLGIQSLHAQGLAELGRVHQVQQAQRALSQCMERFECTVDLIVGWPGQRAATLGKSLDALVDSGVRHVSVYALTVEEGSAWPSLVRRGARQMPDADAQAQALTQVCERLEGAGFEHYEVASYAKAGAAAIHNQKYWVGHDTVGLGPSAYSATHRQGGVRRRGNPRGLDAWARGEEPNVERLEGDAAAGEALWLALRRLAGVELATLRARFAQVDRAWVQRKAARALSRGNLQWVGAERLRVTPGRWLWHDEVGEELV